MQRRAFTAGIGAILVGAGATGSAQADGNDALQQGAQRALRVRLADGRFQTMTGFQISAGAQTLGLNWTQMIPTFNEDRLDFSGAGSIVGSVFRTPF